MLKQIQDLNRHIASMRIDFCAYIQDPNEPLAERWKTFTYANDAFKRKDSAGYLEGHNILPDDFIMYEGPVHMERHQIMSTKELVDRTEDLVKEGYPNIDVIQLKEFILSRNIGFIEYY